MEKGQNGRYLSTDLKVSYLLNSPASSPSKLSSPKPSSSSLLSNGPISRVTGWPVLDALGFPTGPFEQLLAVTSAASRNRSVAGGFRRSWITKDFFSSTFNTYHGDFVASVCKHYTAPLLKAFSGS